MRQGNNHKTYHWREFGAIWRTFGSAPTLHPSLKRPSLVSTILITIFSPPLPLAFQMWENIPGYILLRVCVVRHFTCVAPSICSAAPLAGGLIIPTISKETKSPRGCMTCPRTHLAKCVSPAWLCEPWALAAVKRKLLQMFEQWVRWEH